MSKKIIFNAMILDKKPTGLGVYTKNVLKGILNNEPDLIEMIVCKDKKYLDGININPNKILELKCKDGKLGIIDRNFKINKALKRYQSDCQLIVYSPTHHGISLNNMQQIITIHDLIPIKYKEGRYHQYIYYKQILPSIIKKTDRIITISKNTKNDILEFYNNIDQNKISVIYNGTENIGNVNKNESKDYIKNEYSIENFLLMIGIHYNYKNLHSVIKSYSNIKSKIREKLVIVGNYNCKYGTKLKNLVKELNLEDDVIFLGYIKEEDKNKIYQAAKLFIYASKYEGFGLPPLEAMANEVMVACSNSSSLPEVVGNAGILFDPCNEKDIEEKILYAIQNYEQINEDYIQKGLQNVKKFDWNKTSKEVIKVIKSI